MKSRLVSIFFCVILFSIPLRMRAAECGILCMAVSWLPSASQAAFVGVSGLSMYLGTYLGFRDAFAEQNIKGINRVDRKVSELEKVVAIQGKWNEYLAAILPNSPCGRDIVSEFGKTLTPQEHERFLVYASKNVLELAGPRLSRLSHLA